MASDKNRRETRGEESAGQVVLSGFANSDLEETHIPPTQSVRSSLLDSARVAESLNNSMILDDEGHETEKYEFTQPVRSSSLRYSEILDPIPNANLITSSVDAIQRGAVIMDDRIASLGRKVTDVATRTQKLEVTSEGHGLRLDALEGEAHEDKLTRVKSELVADIRAYDQMVKKQARSTKKTANTTGILLSVSPAEKSVTKTEVDTTKLELTKKVKEYMHLLSDTGRHSLEGPKDLVTQLRLSLRKMEAALNMGHTLTQEEIDTESWSVYVYTDPKMKAFNSVERFSKNPRLQNVLKFKPKDIEDLAHIVSDMTDAYYAIAIHQAFRVDEENGHVTASRLVADDKGEYDDQELSEEDMLIQTHIMRVLVGEYGKDKEGKIVKIVDGMTDELIAKQNALLGSESDAWKMIGTILQIAGYVLLALVALTTVLIMAGVTFPALLVSLAVTAKASFIVSQAINAVTALVAMLGVNMSAGAAAATTAAVFASAVTMFGKAAQAYGGPSQLMLDKDQAANDIAEVASTLMRPAPSLR